MLPEQQSPHFNPRDVLDRLGSRLDRFRTHTAADVLIKLFTESFEISGRENLPPAPAIWVMNHTGWLEAVMAHSREVSEEIPYSLAKIEVKGNTEGKFFRALGARFIYVVREEVDRSAIVEMVDKLAEGNNLLYFPEGTRGRGEERVKLKPAHPGFVFIAKKAAEKLNRPFPIVPMTVVGTEDVMGDLDVKKAPLSERMRVRRKPAVLTIGKPFLIYPGRFPKESLDIIAQEIMLAIRDNLPPERHGAYMGVEHLDFPSVDYTFAEGRVIPVYQVLPQKLEQIVRR
ncbi:hypothetical protein COV53_01995 [Candidatus Gottesmanbacteria bacterium CG11_big_fil_rev_8_21_14_0_20_37_11]|uniref:Phospholipid/glycerol acyltransferase domain-containing protein n=2 Tax=Candidatus Gottesmaniibacteriota TaxID=1752720 RepID=A0A1J4TQA5_9BACT|nr:MAG: hypothetical protein AUJ73_03815 [Candidatus Gottesmanbacteria bacterium CG1_02_37_22]PIR08633.1 MAG: hypothetical protein COV53_01995 [Candidatus Gottesmanbacteria bacterium CG11_big_fil_rev_8_21_14_0_20_37_11]